MENAKASDKPIDKLKDSESGKARDSASDKLNRTANNVKDVFEALREVIIVILLIVLLLFPSTVNRLLNAAGITQADIAGLHWGKAEKAAEQAGEASQKIEAANQKLNTVQQDLDTISKTTTDKDTKSAVERLKAKFDESLETAKTAERDLKESVKVQNSLIQTTKPATAPEEEPWGVVISSDKSLAEAQPELNRAKAQGFQNTAIYQRQNWFGTVITFDSLSEAQAALPQARSKIRDNSFLVRMSQWCPVRKEADKDGVVQCSN